MFRESPSHQIQDYELQTVTFGANFAPFLAFRTLHQLAAKFNLHKWTSQHKFLPDRFFKEELVDTEVLLFVQFSTFKTLGIRWNVRLNSFYFFLDPVGWLYPVIVATKMVMKKV